MESQFIRYCPNPDCGCIINYTNNYDMCLANRKNTSCNNCRFYERDKLIIKTLKETKLTLPEISKKLKISVDIICHVKRKHNIKRKSKIPEKTRILRSKNFKKNVLDKKLNVYGGTDKIVYKKIFKSRYGYDYTEFLLKQKGFKKYYNEVRKITNTNLKKYKHLFSNLDKIGRCGKLGAFQVDHNFSIKKGFEQKITPYLIGHPSNLRIISWSQNLKKSDNCEITINQLIEDASSFLTKNHKILL